MSASISASHLLARTLRRSAPGVTRAVLSTVLDPTRRAAVVEALTRLEQGVAPVLSRSSLARHPMSPAAVRIERSRVRRRRSGEAEQVAVTLWFGEGPALPAAGGSRFGRGAVRVGAGVLSAAALAAATTYAARLGERQAQKPLFLSGPEESRTLVETKED